MIHQTLKEIRKEKKMTIQQVSDITRIPPRTIERMEAGETKVDIERLELLASAYDMSSAEILARDNKGIQFHIDNSNVYSGVAYNSVFHQVEKGLYEKLLQAKEEIIEGLKREVELLKRVK